MWLFDFSWMFSYAAGAVLGFGLGSAWSQRQYRPLVIDVHNQLDRALAREERVTRISETRDMGWRHALAANGVFLTYWEELVEGNTVPEGFGERMNAELLELENEHKRAKIAHAQEQGSN